MYGHILKMSVKEVLVKKHNKHMKVLLISMLLCLLVTGVTANAAAPENVMKSPKAAAGKLVKTQKGVRYRQKSSGKYIKSKWVKVKGHIYYFDKNGYATWAINVPIAYIIVKMN